MLRLVKKLDCQIFFLTSKLSKYSINRRLVGQSLVHVHSITPLLNWLTYQVPNFPQSLSGDDTVALA